MVRDRGSVPNDQGRAADFRRLTVSVFCPGALSARKLGNRADDDQPLLARRFRYPDVVQGGWVGDGAGFPDAPSLDWAAWIAGVGKVASSLDKDFREAEQVSVDVVADTGRLRPLGYAARAEVS